MLHLLDYMVNSDKSTTEVIRRTIVVPSHGSKYVIDTSSSSVLSTAAIRRKSANIMYCGWEESAAGIWVGRLRACAWAYQVFIKSSAYLTTLWGIALGPWPFLSPTCLPDAVQSITSKGVRNFRLVKRRVIRYRAALDVEI